MERDYGPEIADISRRDRSKNYSGVDKTPKHS